ncbi:MAG: carbamoyltransferase HypF [candidate division WOR-3 bacterium]|nr:carbamoyltransferase HypF [candidate division WOR-3 bacterium]
MKEARVQARQILIKGIVQGVGFRPFVYRLAVRHNLTGFVQNSGDGVLIKVEGDENNLNEFVQKLKSESPPLSTIRGIVCKNQLSVGYSKFLIKGSTFCDNRNVLISPDIATCDECLVELFDPSDRRFRYPFINCTNCGPRFTIIHDIPYDRPKTTMQEFLMCNSCQKEYEDPLNRRFHAQPNACPECGPEVELVQSSNLKVKSKKEKAIKKTVKLLKKGKIVAIKGLGGFHLACDALNEEAVKNLRKRKPRDNKPFALMAKDLKVVKRYCRVASMEERVLCSSRRPVVLLRKEIDIPGIAPGNKCFGFMLPYTPLHHLLFSLPDASPVLVMTSGNISNEPISYNDNDAISHLGNIADYFLTHNRKIHTRCDDSVVRVFEDKEITIRRSRGYVPEPIALPFNFDCPILACGAELKNTFCLTKDNYAFLSHYIGDMENLEVLLAFEEGIQHFEHLFSISPTVISYDLHPEYLSTKYAREILTHNPELLAVGVQHHHAHIASCMADNEIKGKVIGVAFDGLGYGTDGNLWGGEFLVADYTQFTRVAHLQYTPMPGGTQAIREPWRMTASYLWHIYGDDFINLGIEFTDSIDKKKWKVLKNLIEYNINSPLTSSVGRLFDAISALLGVCRLSTYEAQPAIELEGIASEGYNPPYDYEIEENTIKPDRIFSGIIKDIKSNIPVDIIASRFHSTIADIVVNMCNRIKEDSYLDRVALSGGVFQNMILLGQVVNQLHNNGFKVYIPHRIPVNDGGISFGQAVIANAKIKNQNAKSPAYRQAGKSKIKYGLGFPDMSGL